jgi:pilus assembly protein Flp/PilA
MFAATNAVDGGCGHLQQYSPRSSKWQNRRETVTQSYGPVRAGCQAAEWMFGSEHVAPPISSATRGTMTTGREQPERGRNTEKRGFVMRNWCTAVIRFIECEDGPTAVEYAVMLALIIVVCLGAITTLGQNANGTFNNVALNTAVKSSAS